MPALTQIAPLSKTRRRTGSILSGLVVLFLSFDAVMKFVKPAPVIQAFTQTGWPDRLAVPLGIILPTCTVLYAIPRTSMLGAILLTGYLGGAVATHLLHW
jgi:DoxX-like family